MTVKKRVKQRVETCSIRRGGQTKKKRARMSDRKGKEVRLGIEHTQPPHPPTPPERGRVSSAIYRGKKSTSTPSPRLDAERGEKSNNMMNIASFTVSQGVHGEAVSATPPLLQLYFFYPTSREREKNKRRSSNVETFVVLEYLLYRDLKRISDGTALWT